MKQYKITSAEFFAPGDTGDDNAFLSTEDLASIKQQTGSGMMFSVADNPYPEIKPAIIREQQYDGKATRNSIS